MNKSYRIRTNVNPNKTNNIKIKLEQEVDQFEILSLKIDQEDDYNNFNCNHGVLVGRVVANGQVGIPNAKVSIFIPLDDEDVNNPEIVAAYPYKKPRDLNEDGKRYNLLPRVATQSGDGIYKPTQPFGSFPTKEEFITNPVLTKVYEKYYKYTTVTNEAGDYMLFGIPTGVQTVHMSVDITDIGRFSMTPRTLVTNLGFSPNLFTDNGSRIKPTNDLSNLPNIETQEISVNVIPFCGDEETFDIGITRQDFRIRAELVNTFTVFGSNFTMAENNWWNALGDGSPFEFLYQIRRSDSVSSPDASIDDVELTDFPINTSPATFRNGQIKETILYLPSEITDENAKNYQFDPQNDLINLSNSEYSRYVEDGQFVYVIPCNRKKIITSETGEDIEVPADSPDGAFSEFYGIFLVEMSQEEYPIDDFDVEGATDERTYRVKFRIPQSFDTNRYDPIEDGGTIPKEYLGKFKIFEGSKFYSVTQFIHSESVDNANAESGLVALHRYTNFIAEPQRDGLIKTGSLTNGSDTYDVFAGNWLNMSLYFTQYASIKDTRANSNPETDRGLPPPFFVDVGVGSTGGVNYLPLIRPETNNQPLGAGLFNTAQYVRADKHFTDFIEIPKADLIKMKELPKSFTKNESNLNGNVKQTNIQAGVTTLATKSEIGFDFDSFEYLSNLNQNPIFYKGLRTVDIIRFLEELNIL